MDTRQRCRRLPRSVQPARQVARAARGAVARSARRLHRPGRVELRRVRISGSTRPVQDVRRLRLQPAHHDPDPGSPDAGCVAGDDRQGLLRRARRGASLRGATVARVGRTRGQARRVDGVGDVRIRAPRTRRRPTNGPVAARAPPRSDDAHRLRTPGPCPIDGAAAGTDLRERNARVVARFAGPGCTRRRVRSGRRPDALDPTARRNRSRLGRSVARNVGTRTRRSSLERGVGGVRHRPRPGARHPARRRTRRMLGTSSSSSTRSCSSTVPEPRTSTTSIPRRGRSSPASPWPRST